ncbi:hypothetical protein PRIPAC_90904 [Pristionchus pacificus]|uniref:Uncharacterized protein n=1 Tax=Pristionchus pacificus TaxID=54126 RepID=A0A454XLV7_PRIPA|nr:hypothetical protein PRIPAC_90904 [Pristionchus pacificus]|eukprot:PDM83449.1 hypothetical protein PRIPAC_35081 [Pristionchus pacificus]
MSSTTVICCLALLTTVSSAYDSTRLRDLPVDNCAHGGAIRDGKCECTLNWTGPKCEEEVCQNGGRPHTNSEGSVKCSCPYGLKGLRCEQATKCDNGKLINGVCECSKGFVGVFCQSRPCHNGSPILIPDMTEYSCTCDIGFTGSFCEEKLECLNGGFVTSNNECGCINGFTGDICNQCEHIVENGECVPEVSEMSLAGTSTAPFLEWHLIAVVGGTMLVLILLACAVYFALRSWRTKPSRVSSAQGSAIVPHPDGTDV